MNLVFNLLVISTVVFSEDVCVHERCKCLDNNAKIYCDSKHFKNLTDLDFPDNVVTLSFVQNELKFDTVDDRSKIENLQQLADLILNKNPLGTIPPFNNSNIRSLSLHDTSLISAEFPSTYYGSTLQRISLSENKIRSINENDFAQLRNSRVTELSIDSASISTIDSNAFHPLSQLQSLSLKMNLLKSCEFLSTFRVLSSIKLDGNQFTSIPQQLSVPNDIKSFFFTHNSISIIDESSPLYTWMKKNYTNIKIYLAGNPFDCCQSLWFIRFLKSSNFTSDANLLTCAQPTSYAGQLLIKLDPDQMNCGGIPPSKSWWTPGRIAGISIGGITTVIIVTVLVVFFVRQRKTRSGYTEIDGTDDPVPNAPPEPSPHLPFPSYGEENGDDVTSQYSTAFTRQTGGGSQAPTASAISVYDENRN